MSPCFNTQPPEGGWFLLLNHAVYTFCFNTQPPEGGWAHYATAAVMGESFNTQPPEGGWEISSIDMIVIL